MSSIYLVSSLKQVNSTAYLCMYALADKKLNRKLKLLRETADKSFPNDTISFSYVWDMFFFFGKSEKVL